MSTEDLKARVLEAAKRDREAAETAETARSELRTVTLELLDAGVSEGQAAWLAGVSRMTIRAWLGKR